MIHGFSYEKWIHFSMLRAHKTCHLRMKFIICFPNITGENTDTRFSPNYKIHLQVMGITVPRRHV